MRRARSPRIFLALGVEQASKLALLISRVRVLFHFQSRGQLHAREFSRATARLSCSGRRGSGILRFWLLVLASPFAA
jgi:hypothetical protein